MNIDIKYILILIVCLFIACDNKKSTSTPSDSPTTPPAKESVVQETVVQEASERESKKEKTAPKSSGQNGSQSDTIIVSNLEDLVENARSNRVIILDGGTHTIEEHIVYFITEEEQRVINKNVEETRSMGGQLYIKGLTNFQLIGKKRAKITSKNDKAIPLFVVQGKNLKFSNLTISKAVKGAADLSYISGCQNVEFVQCNFDGGGTHGMNILNTDGLTFMNCKIQRCHKGFIKAYVAKNLRFSNTEISENICTVAPINIYGEGSNVIFDNVTIHNNKKDLTSSFENSDRLFTAGNNMLHIKNSSIENNPGFKYLGVSQNLLNNTTIVGLQ